MGRINFDYTSPTLFPPVNNNDNKIVFFFDFGTQGDGGPNSTYYFDDIAFSTDLSTPNFDILKVKSYPNPVANQITIEANEEIQEVAIYTLLGQEVIKETIKSNTTTLQTNGLQSGIYIAKMTMGDGTESTSKFIKI